MKTRLTVNTKFLAMTTLTQNIETLLVENENAVITLSQESLKFNGIRIKRGGQPISELKRRKFRRLFNRHSMISR